jgi:signal transduction histidine kinase
MKTKIIAFTLIFLITDLVNAQQHLVDSITKELQQPMPDSSRAISMMRLAIDYELVDTSLAYRAYREAIKFAKEKKLYYQLGRIYQNQSVLLTIATSYAEAKASLDSAITSYQKSDHPKAKKWEASAYGDIGNGLKSQNNLQQAAQYYLKSISLFEKLGLPEELTLRYCNMSSLFGDIREFDKQKEYGYKGLASAKKSGVKLHLFMAYFMLANYYNSQEEGKTAKLYLDSSRLYFDEAANINSIDILFSYFLISADVFKKMNQYDSAFYFFRQCFDLSKKYNYGYGKAESQLQMGAICILQKKYMDAEKYLEAGIEEAKAINYFNMLDDGYKYLSDVYAVTGRYKMAWEYFQKYKEISDSAVNIEAKKNITELEKKFETEKKEGQIKQLEADKKVQQLSIDRKNILNNVLIGGALAVLVISLLSYRNYNQKQKLQQQRISELEAIQQLATTEAVLKGEEQERTRLAKDLHDGLGGMLSGIKYSFQTMKGNLVMTPENHQAFERSMDMLDSSIKEMRRVAHNMMPETLVKFGLDTALKDFCNEINQGGALKVNYQSIGLDGAVIDQTTAITLYRIVQELLNNTMKHASARNVIVQVSRTDNILSVTVEDDGKGFDTSILKQSKGIGWSNIQSRVEFLKGKFDVNSQKEKGTSVLIELPV